MKINKINGEKVTFFPKKSSPKFQTTYKAEDKVNNLQSLPKYYQAINCVYFSGNAKFLACPVKDKNNKTTSIKIYIPTQNKESSTFEFNEASSVKILTTKSGALDNQAISLFAELFNDYFKVSKSKFKKEKDFLKEIIKDDTQT